MEIRPQQHGFAEHVLLDGYAGDTYQLNDEGTVYASLNDLPGFLGLERHAEPEIHRYYDSVTADSSGVLGLLHMEAGHSVLYTSPQRGIMTVDIYSCVHVVDIVFVTRYFKHLFNLQEIERHVITRAVNYPLQKHIHISDITSPTFAHS